MQKIFEEYGGVIVTVIAVVALIAIVTVLLADGGVMSEAFNNIVTAFTNKADALVNAIDVPVAQLP